MDRPLPAAVAESRSAIRSEPYEFADTGAGFDVRNPPWLPVDGFEWLEPVLDEPPLTDDGFDGDTERPTLVCRLAPIDDGTRRFPSTRLSRE